MSCGSETYRADRRRDPTPINTRSAPRSPSPAASGCSSGCGVGPNAARHWAPIDPVPTVEIADIKDSSLSTPYNAWALAARQRQRAFVFWTYVSALAEDPLVRLNAEDLAREALSDGNLLRRERWLPWRAERRIGAEGATAHDGIDDSASAALLESLLLKDMMTWSQGLPPPSVRNS